MAKNKIEEKTEEVTIPKSTLQAILDRIDGLEESNKKIVDDSKKKDEKIEMLTEISDKGRLARYEEQNNGEIIRTARISFWEGLPILAWVNGKNEVGYRDGRLIVNQTIRLFLDEGRDQPTEKELDYLYWTQNVNSQSGDIIEKSITPNGSAYTLQMKDGKKIKVDVRFLNAF